MLPNSPLLDSVDAADLSHALSSSVNLQQPPSIASYIPNDQRGNRRCRGAGARVGGAVLVVPRGQAEAGLLLRPQLSQPHVVPSLLLFLLEAPTTHGSFPLVFSPGSPWPTRIPPPSLPPNSEIMPILGTPFRCPTEDPLGTSLAFQAACRPQFPTPGNGPIAS